MRVNNINSNTYNPAAKGYTYRPNRTPVYINPIKQHVDNFFERTLKLSKSKIVPIFEELEPYYKKVDLKSEAIKTYGFDFDKQDSSNKYVMVLHGLGQNVSSNQPLYKSILENTTYSVFAPEYRGFGENPPSKISKKTFLEDTQLALDYLQNEKNVKPENICIVGHSLGGFIASQLASKNPNLEHLILVSTVDSLASELTNSVVIKNVSSFQQYLLKHVSLIRSYLKNIFDTTKNLAHTSTPVDIVHSTNDKVINYKSAKQLAKICPNLQGVHLLTTGGHALETKKIETITSLLK